MTVINQAPFSHFFILTWQAVHSGYILFQIYSIMCNKHSHVYHVYLTYFILTNQSCLLVILIETTDLKLTGLSLLDEYRVLYKLTMKTNLVIHQVCLIQPNMDSL